MPPDYVDDRSTGTSVITSYYNAINRQEYSRAYSYWDPDLVVAQLQPFDQFVQGYANTTSVAVSTGTEETEGAMGSLYYRVPVTLIATMTDGSTQTFVGCYLLRLGDPAMQTQPPFKAMSIQQANIQPVANGADTSGLMAQACAAGA